MRRQNSRKVVFAILLLALLVLCPEASAAKDKNTKKKDKNKKKNKPAANPTKKPAASAKSPTKVPEPLPTPVTVPAAVAASTTTSSQGSKEVCRTYTVKSGDSAMSVAQAESIDYDQLVAALGQCIGYTDGAILQVGQAICLPPFTPSCKFVTVSGAPSCKMYTVQPGDTVDSISKAFSLYPQTLIDANKGEISSKDPVLPGKAIRLPPWDTAICKDLSASAPKCRVYNVKTGDTIFSIASSFSLSSEDLVKANAGFTINTPLTVGQPIRIPPFPAECGNQGTLVTGPSGNTITNCRSYLVGKGDSLSSISSKYGLTNAEILAINPAVTNPQTLTTGLALKLPPWGDSCPEKGYVVNQPSTGTSISLIGNPPGQAVLTTPPTITAPAPPPVQVNRPTLVPVTATTPGPTSSQGTTATTTPHAPSSGPTASNLPTMDVEMVLQGKSSQEFANSQSAVVQALAAAAGVPVQQVTVRFVLGVAVPSRRMLSTTDVVKVQCTIQGDPVLVQSNLQTAVTNGSLAAQLQTEGLTLKTLTTISPTGQVTPIVVPGTVAEAANQKKVSKYVIIAAAAGGGVVFLLVVIGCCRVSAKRRRQRELEQEEERAAAAAKARYIGANAYVSTVSGKKVQNGSFTDGHMITSQNHARAPFRAPSRTPRPTQQQTNSGESLPDMPAALQEVALEAYGNPIDVVLSTRASDLKPQQHEVKLPQRHAVPQQPQLQSSRSVTFETYAPPGIIMPQALSSKSSSQHRSSSQRSMNAPAAAIESTSPFPSPRAQPPRITTVSTTSTLRATSVSPQPSPRSQRAVARVMAPPQQPSPGRPAPIATRTSSVSSQNRLPRVASAAAPPSPFSSRNSSGTAAPSSRPRGSPLPRVAVMSTSGSSMRSQQPAPVPEARSRSTSTSSRQQPIVSSTSIPGSLRSKMAAPAPTLPTRRSSQPSPQGSPTRNSRRSLYGDL